jgi:Flp pilus assembly protein CpaB
VPVPLRRPTLRAIRRWRRRPAPYWLVAIALAALTAFVVARLVGQAEAAAARFGSLRPTLVALRELDAGAVVAPGDTELRPLPAELVPATAIDRSAEGTVVTSPIHTGEVVVASRLAPGGVSPTAALLPPGTRGLAVPAGPATIPLRRGDVVDVLATFDPSTTEEGNPTVAVARDAVVVDVGREAVTVAVTEEQAPRVAFALAAGAVALALTEGLPGLDGLSAGR